jgi:hypothetical protein
MVLIPWRICVRSGRIVVSLELVLYLFIWGVWMLIVDLDITPWVTHMRRWWIAWVLPLVAGYVAPFVLLLVFDYVPKMLNSGWPLTSAQYQPLEAGALTFWNLDKRRYGPEEPDTRQVRFEGSISNGNGKSLHYRLATTAPESWQRYARALTQGLIKPRFSVRAARFYRVPDQEFSNLQRGWVAIGFAEKTSPAPNARTRLTEWGTAYMERLAEQE